MSCGCRGDSVEYEFEEGAADSITLAQVMREEAGGQSSISVPLFGTVRIRILKTA